MKILAVDTSSSVATVAVTDGTRLLGEYIINHKKTHSQKLMPMIDEIMRTLELSPTDIDIYAASIGPGSFTGLRIGITTIKALAFAAGKPVVGVPTLDALAYNTQSRGMLICPIMDARNNQVYTALYEFSGGVSTRLTDYMGIHIAELVQIIKEKNRETVFTGDGIEVHWSFLENELGDRCIFAPGNLQVSRASSVAYGAFLKASAGETQDNFDLLPFYLRQSQAEREFEKKKSINGV